jgi:hypothetical protein
MRHWHSIFFRSPPSFSPMAVVLTSGTNYTVPTGATTMKAWAVGPGRSAAGGTAYKTWSVIGGDTINYVVGISGTSDTNITYSSTTITGNRPTTASGGGYNGGDGGANGGASTTYSRSGTQFFVGGAVGGNTTIANCYGRSKATNISGLFSAVILSGQSFSADCANGSFGDGGLSTNNIPSIRITCGLGGGGWNGTNNNGGNGAVVLYFT